MSSQHPQIASSSQSKQSAAPIILPNPSQITGQRGGIGGVIENNQLGQGPHNHHQFKNFPSLGGPPASSPFGESARAGAQSTGEMIADTYHTYHSIGTQAPLVGQDEDLSIVGLASRNVKVFVNPNQDSYARNLMCFIENSQTTPAAKSNTIQAAMKSLSSNSGSAAVDVSNNMSLLVN